MKNGSRKKKKHGGARKTQQRDLSIFQHHVQVAKVLGPASGGESWGEKNRGTHT